MPAQEHLEPSSFRLAGVQSDDITSTRLDFIGRVEEFGADWARMVAVWPPLGSVVSGMGVHRMPALMNHRPVLETNYYGNITSEQAACRKTIDASRKCLSYLERMHGSRLSRRGVCAMCRSWRYGRDFVLFNYSARCPSSCTADEPTSQVQVRERLLQLLQDCSAAAARGSCLK